MQPVLDVREDTPLAPFTTFGIGGPARYFANAHSERDVEQAVTWAHERNLPLFVIGGGSNLLVRDSGFDGLVLHIAIQGIDRPAEDHLDVGAGESWDALVDHAIALNLAGIECLAGIPGSVGGTPVQNVGAYGQEVSETIASVHVFDRLTNRWQELSNTDCRFRYRESLFNTGQPNRYIVTRVRFRLNPDGPATVRYAELQRRFAAKSAPTLAEVAAAVRDLRRSKGMVIVPGDPDTRSAGSFFKNPIVGKDLLVHAAHSTGVPISEIPHWPAGDGLVKLPAAWLLERAGIGKGYGEGPAGVSTKHTLALTNRGGATCADVERLQQEIVSKVDAKFGLRLEREPVLVG